jgi:hypothetical protein
MYTSALQNYIFRVKLKVNYVGNNILRRWTSVLKLEWECGHIFKVYRNHLKKVSLPKNL